LPVAASSRALDVTRSYQLQIFAHLLFTALNEPGFEILDRGSDPSRRAMSAGAWGSIDRLLSGAVAVWVTSSTLRLPWAHGGLSVGYIPTPGTPTFEFQLGAPIY
jgi:hypothetical protein